jgi:hypothetical protein
MDDDVIILGMLGGFLTLILCIFLFFAAKTNPNQTVALSIDDMCYWYYTDKVLEWTVEK